MHVYVACLNPLRRGSESSMVQSKEYPEPGHLSTSDGDVASSSSTSEELQGVIRLMLLFGRKLLLGHDICGSNCSFFFGVCVCVCVSYSNIETICGSIFSREAANSWTKMDG